MSYGGWSGSLCCRVIKKVLSFEGKTLGLSSSAECFQCLIWSSIAMSLTHFGAGLRQLLKLKKGAKKRNGNLGYEEATNTLKNEWASSRWPTPASPVSSPPFRLTFSICCCRAPISFSSCLILSSRSSTSWTKRSLTLRSLALWWWCFSL